MQNIHYLAGALACLSKRRSPNITPQTPHDSATVDDFELKYKLFKPSRVSRMKCGALRNARSGSSIN